MNQNINNDSADGVIKAGSIFSFLYFLLTMFFVINSFLNKVEILNPLMFSIIFGIVNVIFVMAMFLGRESKLSAILAFCQIPLAFLVLIFNFGTYYIFVPIFISSLIMFFACKAGETLKTVMGTIYLLLYVVGIVAFILANNFFGSALNQIVLTTDLPPDSPAFQIYSQGKINEVNQNNISPDGKLKYYIVDTDGISGKVELWVKPNEKDKNFLLFSFKQKGRNKIVGYIFGRGDNALPKVEWTGNNKITYTFPGQKTKNSIITDEDLKKDYFEFMTT